MDKLRPKQEKITKGFIPLAPFLSGLDDNNSDSVRFQIEFSIVFTDVHD